MRRIPRNFYILIILCFGLTFWIFVKNIGFPELPSPSAPGQINDNGPNNVGNEESKFLSNKLDNLEAEIISQQAISSVLLDKVKATFQKEQQQENQNPPNNVGGLGAADHQIEVPVTESVQNNNNNNQNAINNNPEINNLEKDKPDNNKDKEESPQFVIPPAPGIVEDHDHIGEIKSEEIGAGAGIGGIAVDHQIEDENGAHEEEIDPKEPVIAVLVFVCNRPTVKRNVDQLLRYRPSETKFPIIVSQDCGHHQSTTAVLEEYKDKITHIYQPDLSEIKVPSKEIKLSGYYKIARHYGWALNYTFYTLKHINVIIVEDDLDIAPDFFEYFSATLPILRKDSSLWCVSAWNDNGKPKRINETAYELLYRTDFFPGLGWMLTKELWDELSVKWAKSYWDDWMREPAQRKDRSCIRPEISRTSTFGKNGVSHGTYYQTHLRYIKLSDKFVPFSKIDLSYLTKDTYDHDFVKRVYSSQVLSSVEELSKLTTDPNIPDSTEFRLTYRTKADFTRFAKRVEIMDDLRAGVPRTAYRGVVTFMYNNHRVYLAPGANWVGYQP